MHVTLTKVVTCILGLAAAMAAGAGTVEPQDAPTVQRRDIGQVFLRLDADLAGFTGQDEGWRAWNRRFDRVAWQFFQGKLLDASDDMAALRADVLGLRGDDAVAFRVVSSLRPVLDDPLARDTSVRVEGLWPVAAAAGRTIVAALDLGPEFAPIAFRVDCDDVGRARTVGLDLPELPDESPEARVTILSANGHPCATVAWAPSDESWDERRKRLLKVVAEVEEPGLAPSLREFRERCEWLVADPNARRSLHVLSSPRAYWDALESEAFELASGRDPYRNELVAGHRLLWRSIAVGRREVYTVQRIAPVKSAEDLRPLVIALHGAGGDEAFFARAGGGGMLVDLSREHGFHLICPNTYQLLYDMPAFDAILDDALERYPVDPERIYVMGHSLGGITTSTIVNLRAARVAAGCCIAGARRLKVDVPLLLQAAELDTIFPIEDFRRDARIARDDGLPATLEEHADTGHVLILGPALRRALRFFGLVTD